MNTMEKQSSSLIQDSKDKRIRGSWRTVLLTALVCVLLVFLMLSLVLINIASQPIEKRVIREKFTVVINTFKRPDMLESALVYYSKCPLVRNIHVTWSESRAPPQSLLAKYSKMEYPKVVFDTFEADSLNNRFKPLKEFFTDGVFSVDDDMRVPCEHLERAFEVWLSSPRAIVGFMPRIHVIKQNRLIYRCWWTVWIQGAYSIVLTKAAFLHHDYFIAYTNSLPAGVHSFVDQGRNCEDIAMQYLVANMTGQPPVYVKGRISDLGVLGGISTDRNIVTASHMDARSRCLNQLSKFFAGTPLVYSRTIVDSAANGWVNMPSAWGEFISSDLWNFL